MVQIYYFCHPLYQHEVRVFKRITLAGIRYYSIRLFDNSRAYIPEWMTDPLICQAHVLNATPVCSLSALMALGEHLKRFESE